MENLFDNSDLAVIEEFIEDDYENDDVEDCVDGGSRTGRGDIDDVGDEHVDIGSGVGGVAMDDVDGGSSVAGVNIDNLGGGVVRGEFLLLLFILYLTGLMFVSVRNHII